MKLLTSAEMRDLEQRAAAAGTPTDELMEQAGLAVAQEVWMQLGSLEDRRIVALVGPGANGGDALVAARHLAEWGAQVRCYALRPRDDDRWRAALDAGAVGGDVEQDDNFEALDALMQGAETVIDGLLGTGRARPIEGELAQIMQRLAAARSRAVPPKLIAVDLPTGVDADSGRADTLTVAADETVTFHAPKVGLYLQPGAAFAGSVQTVEIGIPAGLDDHLGTELLERRAAKALLPQRAPDAHKGTHGTLLIVAGSARYPGAAILAANAAYRAGAGLVTVAAPASLYHAMIAAAPEATWLPLPDHDHPGAIGPAALPLLREAAQTASALAIGCGLGLHEATGELVHQLLADDALAHLPAIVVDADALNHLAAGRSAADTPSQRAAAPPDSPAPTIGGSAAPNAPGQRVAADRRAATDTPGQHAATGRSAADTPDSPTPANDESAAFNASGRWNAAAPLILTPHPGEMARLTNRANDDVQSARLDLARDSAADWSATVVLKGANTIIAAPDGRARVSEIAQPALATAGTGDVLTGAIGALLAQGLPPYAAATLAVYLHADAGNKAARARGTIGVTATDAAEHLATATRSLAGEDPIETPALGGGLPLGGGFGGDLSGGLEQGMGGGLEALLGGGPPQ